MIKVKLGYKKIEYLLSALANLVARLNNILRNKRFLFLSSLIVVENMDKNKSYFEFV